MSAEMVLPPGLDTEDGEPRTIGVEIEFAGMSCEQAAALSATFSAAGSKSSIATGSR